MLIIRRKAGERLMIGPEIELTVISIGETAIKLGVTAPDELTIDRQPPIEGFEPSFKPASGRSTGAPSREAAPARIGRFRRVLIDQEA
jgi:carbon storage regulator CsrA